MRPPHNVHKLRHRYARTAHSFLERYFYLHPSHPSPSKMKTTRRSCRFCILAFLLVSLSAVPFVQALANGPRTTPPNGRIEFPVSENMTGRREWLQRGGLVSAGIAVLTTGGVSLVSDVQPAWAESASSSSSSPSPLPERDALLKAINSKLGEEQVLKCIDDLVAAAQSTQSIKQQSVSLADRIDGQWKLIWSIKDDKFSPLLQLPGPLRPTSYQYAGSAATPIVGEGRIAQMLTNGILGPTKTWLSSGVVEYPSDQQHSASTTAMTLQIRPPFRLEVETPLTPNRQVLVEAGSDAGFRAANVRSAEAQLAPPNLYQQLYVEEKGPGSLRISKVVEGDPVIVGATFVHVKL